MEVEALVDAMQQSLEEVEAETHKETLRDVETEASAYTVAGTMTDVNDGASLV